MKINILILIFIAHIQNAYCCKCANSSFLEHIGYYNLIFKGVPLSLELSKTSKTYKFISKKVWKGKTKDTFFISTGLDQGSCEFKFEIGKEYIIYSNNFETGFCSRNIILKNKTEELKLDDHFAKKQELFINDSITITKIESIYLQEFQKDKIDLFNKRVLFTNNHSLYTKTEWFKYNQDHNEVVLQTIELTKKDKEKYKLDYLVVAWSKIKVNEKIKQKILSQFK